MFSYLLNAAKEGDVKKSRLYHRVETSHKYFKKLFETAIGGGYISINENGKCDLTKKGIEFCEDWEEFKNLKQKAEEFIDEAENIKEKILKKHGLENL